jgi:hypothetical protein
MDEIAEIFNNINVWLLAFTLVGLLLGSWLFYFYTKFPLVGLWFLWTFAVWWIIMGYDQLGIYYGWKVYSIPQDALKQLLEVGWTEDMLSCKPLYPWYLESRLSMARLGVLGGIYGCFFYGFLRFRGVRLRDAVKLNIGETEPPEVPHERDTRG